MMSSSYREFETCAILFWIQFQVKRCHAAHCSLKFRFKQQHNENNNIQGNPQLLVIYQFACNYYSRDKTIFIINNILKMRNTTHNNHHTYALPNLNMNIISNIAMNTISRLPGFCIYIYIYMCGSFTKGCTTEFSIRKPSPAMRKHDIRMLMLYGKFV